MLTPLWEKAGILLSTHQVLLGWLGLLSLATFLGSLLIIPLLVVRLPRDYLLATRGVDPADYGIWWWPLMIAKNIMGLILAVAGIVMLVLPGQGLLTLFIGLSLVNFPGKSRILHRMVQHKPILRAINWLRKRRDVPPLDIPPET